MHYLNVPYPDDNKLATVAPSLALWADKKEWTKDELVSQLKPMCKYIIIQKSWKVSLDPILVYGNPLVEWASVE